LENEKFERKENKLKKQQKQTGNDEKQKQK
jgi:hypothetical protein